MNNPRESANGNQERAAQILRQELPELAVFSYDERERLLASLQQEIIIGLNRIRQSRPPTEADSGLPAVPYPVDRPKRLELYQCPPQSVLACICGGQEWRATILHWDGRNWHEEKAVENQRTIPENQRVFRGDRAVADFIDLMAGLAGGSLARFGRPALIKAMAVSFGFPQGNEKVGYGIEAFFKTEILPKHWLVEGGIGVRLGHLLLGELQHRGYSNLQRTVIANDTISTALDITAGDEPAEIAKANSGARKNGDLGKYERVLPLGVVIGSGANIAMEYLGRLVNLEIGEASSLGIDPILARMHKLGLTPKGQHGPTLEYYFSGNYQLPRLVGALSLLADRGLCDARIVDRFLEIVRSGKNEAKILDRLITGEMTSESLNQYLSFEVKPADFSIVKETARLVMAKAVEVAALMISSVLLTGNWHKGEIPVVGSVFWKAKVGPEGEVFGDQVMKLVNAWVGGDLKAVKADELRGLAGLDLIQVKQDF